MKKNLLITGRPGSGKTTAVESAIQRFAADAGGFLTREIREGGVRRGFRIVALDGVEAVLAHVGIAGPVKVGKYGVDVGALEAVAIPAIERAVRNKRLVVIDEIGRMELASEAFRRSVLGALDSGRAVLATIQQHRHPFTDAVKRRPDVRLFELTAANRGRVMPTIERALGDIVGGMVTGRG